MSNRHQRGSHGRHDSDGHGRRDRDYDRSRDRRGNDDERDSRRGDRSRDRNDQGRGGRDSGSGRNDRGRDNKYEDSRNYGRDDSSRFNRGGSNGNYGYGHGGPSSSSQYHAGGSGFFPPPGVPPMYGYGPPGNLPMGFLPPPVVPMGFSGYQGMSLMGYPPGHRGHRNEYDDDRSRKRDTNDRDYSTSRFEPDDRSKRPRMDREYPDQRRMGPRPGGSDGTFLEDVQPGSAFTLDTEPNYRHLKYYTLNGSNASRYESTYRRDDILGATEEELNNLPFRSVFSRCVRPVGIDDHGNQVDDEGNILDEDGKPLKLTAEEREKMEEEATKKKPLRKQKVVSATPFISFGKAEGATSSKIMELRDKADLDGKKKKLSIRDQVEKYNQELRENARNVELWRKFVRFQDQVMQHEAEEFNEADDGKKKDGKKAKLKRNRKALVEKKISILDKAIESNPKDLDLHLDKLELVAELYKPRYTLGEWRKLVTVYQQLGAFWNEYLMFASTQAAIYKMSVIIETFEKAFQKFRLMLNPNYPSFQKPEKFLLLLADMLLGLSIVLRDSGFTEKAIALQQAQLEMLFNFPTQMIEDKSKAEWEKVLSLFELFWDAGTLRYGEPDSPGWAKVVQEKYTPTKTVIGVPESKLSEWEDKLFDSIAETKRTSEVPQSAHWITGESFRSTFQWLPWRENCSDIDSVEDNQRMVLSNELTPFLISLTEEAGSSFELAAAQFRYVVNFLLLLQDDFLPRTQALDSILSPFNAVGLSEAKEFFSEIYYWKMLLNLYTKGDDEIIIPDGFNLEQYTVPGAGGVNLPGKQSSSEGEEECEQVKAPYPEEITQLRKDLTKQNSQKHLAFVRSVVGQSVENLPPKFASLLALMYIRFEERSTYYSSDEAPKARMKAAKNLLQNEKLRNSVPLYGEMALLEYFCSKNKSKACDILVKAINSSAIVLRKGAETKEVADFVSGDWETLAEITRLYRLLAEIQLAENRDVSLQILVALGNNLSDVSLVEDAESINTNRQLVARRMYEKILAFLLPEDPAEDDKDHLHLWDGDKSVEYLVQNTNLLVEWISAYALFLYLSSDFTSICELFTKTLKHLKGTSELNKTNKFQSAIVNMVHLREQFYLIWCKIGILEIAKDPMQHGRFRQILVDALTEFPASPPLLLIFTEVEKQSSIAGKIWRHMTGVIKNESSLVSLHWAPLFMALGLARRVDQLRKDEEIGLPEFGLGGPAVPPDTIFHKLDAVLEIAEQNRATRICPLIWRIHMKMNYVRFKKSKGRLGEDTVEVKQLEATQSCPANKSVYLDSVAYLPRKMSEVIDLLKEKQLYIRLPLEELNLLLENEEAEDDGGSTKADKEEEEESDGGEEEDEAAAETGVEQAETVEQSGIVEQAGTVEHEEVDSSEEDDNEKREEPAGMTESMSEGEIEEDDS